MTDENAQPKPTDWDALLQLHRPMAFRLAYLMLGDAADAEDVLQEAFIRAFNARAQLDPARDPKPWLLTIVANLARNRRRAIGRYWRAIQRAIFAQPESFRAPDMRDENAHRADAALLWHAVQKLNQPDQEMGQQITLPAQLGPPDAVFVQTFIGTTVLFVWLDPNHPKLARAMLQVFDSTAIFGKMGARVVREVRVRGKRAVWIEGEHLLQGRNGEVRVVQLVQKNALIWVQNLDWVSPESSALNSRTYRLEIDGTAEDAVTLAESVN